MRFSHLALALTATTTFAILGASPALASVSSSPQAHSATPQTATISTGPSGLSLSTVVGDACGLTPGDTDPSRCDDSVIDDDWDKV